MSAPSPWSVDVLLLRHAQSVWNVERRWAGQADPPLSDWGRRSAQAVVTTLLPHGFSAVASSDLGRARETAQILGRGLSLTEVLLEPGLRERAAPRWSGLTADEIERSYPGQLDRWRAGTFYDIPGAEPWELFTARVRTGLETVAEQLKGHGRLLVVTHAGALRAIERVAGLRVHKPTNLDGLWVQVGDTGIGAVEEFRLRRPVGAGDSRGTRSGPT